MALQWLSLVGAIWLQSINGANSNFSAYSSELKRLLSTSQLRLNNLAAASDAAKLLGWLSGLAAACLPLHLLLLIGSLLGAIGYGLQFLILSGQLPRRALSYPVFFFLTVIAGNSICWINTVSYIVAINNFPLDRQIAIGLSSSYVGLSGKIYTDVVDAFVGPNATPAVRARAFLLANALLPLVVCVLAAPLARDIPVVKSRKLERGFFAMFVITIVTGIFAVVTSFPSVVSSRFLPHYGILLGMAAMLVAPLAIPLWEKVGEKRQKRCLIRVHVDEQQAHTKTIAIQNGEENNNVENFNFGEIIEEVEAKVMITRLEFWLYYFVYLFGATLGLVYLNNLGQIAESRGYPGTSSLVSLSAAFTFFGRLLPSLVDYFSPTSTSKKMALSRGGSMGAIMVPMCGAFFLLLNKKVVFLYTSTAIIGVCTGAITSISVSTTTELFGVKNFGVNHNIVVSNIPIGTFLFGGFAALLYNRGGNGSSDGKCMGQKCYQTSFLIWGSLCALGVLLAFALHARTKKLYSSNRVL